MTIQNSSFLGKKFSCPSCRSQLKFRRPPKSLLQICPNCRRKLRLQEELAAVDQDELLKEAIELLVSSRTPKKRYDYARDPELDRSQIGDGGVVTFDQPWPETAGEVVYQKAEVICTEFDFNRAASSRLAWMSGEFKRVSVFRTGQVEEIEVTGHWWDFEPHETKLGLLSRSVVRELNRNPLAKRFAARINCFQETTRNRQKYIELFIDLAVEQEDDKKAKQVADFR